jgi:uncharacterized membrane protein (TIGR02234 family)
VATSVGRLRDDVAAAVVAKGGTAEHVGSSLTAWYWTCLLASLLCLAAFVVAVIAAPRWPAMGSRYDAPTTGAETTRQQGQPSTEQEMWRALDDGQDPTA